MQDVLETPALPSVPETLEDSTRKERGVGTL